MLGEEVWGFRSYPWCLVELRSGHLSKTGLLQYYNIKRHSIQLLITIQAWSIYSCDSQMSTNIWLNSATVYLDLITLKTNYIKVQHRTDRRFNAKLISATLIISHGKFSESDAVHGTTAQCVRKNIKAQILNWLVKYKVLHFIFG